MNSCRFLIYLAIVVASYGFACEGTRAEPLPFASKARVAGDGDRTRFIADLSRKIDLVAFVLANPYRVIVDLPETRFQFSKGAGRKGRGLVGAWRFGLFAPGKSRIVLDLKGPAKIDKAFVLPPTSDQPARLVVDMLKVTELEFKSLQAKDRHARRRYGKRAGLKSDRLLVRAARKGKPTIVLDPGHGGLDAGAVGRKGNQEKEIVLKFSVSLKAGLEKTGRYTVFITRQSDTFLALKERVRFARVRRADLLISIHADSVRQKRVRGATVYTQSETASDQVAHEIATKANKSDIIAGVELDDEPPVVSDILIDLTRRETKNFSIHFARTLIGQMRGTQRLNKNPHRSAGFSVLRAHDVPSILLELGYLSNQSDEKLLSDPQWQKKISKNVVQAIDAFFRPRIARGLN